MQSGLMIRTTRFWRQLYHPPPELVNFMCWWLTMYLPKSFINVFITLFITPILWLREPSQLSSTQPLAVMIENKMISIPGSFRWRYCISSSISPHQVPHLPHVIATAGDDDNLPHWDSLSQAWRASVIKERINNYI